MSYTPLSLQTSGLARAPLDPDCTCLDRCDCSFLAHVHNTNVRLAHSYRRCECEELRCEHYYREYVYCEQDIENGDAIYPVMNPSQDLFRAALAEQRALYLTQAEDRLQAAERIAADLAEIQRELDEEDRETARAVMKRARGDDGMAYSANLASPGFWTATSTHSSASSPSLFSPISSGVFTPMNVTLDGYFARSPATSMPSRLSRSGSCSPASEGKSGTRTSTPLTRQSAPFERVTIPYPAFMIAPSSPTASTSPGASPNTYLSGPPSSVPMERTAASRGHKRQPTVASSCTMASTTTTTRSATSLNASPKSRRSHAPRSTTIPRAAIYAEIESRPFWLMEGCPRLTR